MQCVVQWLKFRAEWVFEKRKCGSECKPEVEMTHKPLEMCCLLRVSGFRDLLLVIVTDSVTGVWVCNCRVTSCNGDERRKQSHALSGVYICPDKARSEW